MCNYRTKNQRCGRGVDEQSGSLEEKVTTPATPNRLDNVPFLHPLLITSISYLVTGLSTNCPPFDEDEQVVLNGALGLLGTLDYCSKILVSSFLFLSRHQCNLD